MQKAWTVPVGLAVRTSVNIAGNAVNLAQGTKIIIQSGYLLTITEKDVEVSDGDEWLNQGDYQEAKKMAAALSILLWGSGEEQNAAEGCLPEYADWAENITKVLMCFGIDTAKEFTVNGVKCEKLIISQAE
ncbi:MAG: hypothetical protein HDR30_00380 [Lachnospiraceae bacterium]|nr:hypothetical protein [Lachnospiraceae bacterium]